LFSNNALRQILNLSLGEFSEWVNFGPFLENRVIPDALFISPIALMVAMRLSKVAQN
jgi:hypothetical protein